MVVQEIDIQSKRSGYYDQVKKIATLGQFQYYAVAYTWDKRWVPYPLNQSFKKQFGPTQAGQVIFSRYPIVFSKIHRFDKPKSLPFWERWFYLDRVVQIVQIKHPIIGSISLNHLHLEAFDEKERIFQMNQALEMASDEPRPQKTLILGDFNIDFNQKLPQDINRSLLQKFNEIGSLFDLQGTFPSNAPTERIDSLLLSHDWQIKRVEIVDHPDMTSGDISDHLPVYAILDLKKESNNE